MDRRTFISGVALGVFVASRAAEAQRVGKVYRIDTNALPSAPEFSRDWRAFPEGLGERGWVEGQDLVIEYRWVDGWVERCPSLAAELVSRPRRWLQVSEVRSSDELEGAFDKTPSTPEHG